MSLLITLGLGASGGVDPVAPSGDTPWMHMLLPIVTVTIGPDYATDINNALGRTVDAHDHSPTRGKPVPTAGLAIDADLSFAGFAAKSLSETQYVMQSPNAGSTGFGLLYFSGEDLYAVDGSGVAIQITSGGSVNVTGTGGWTGDYGSGTSTANFTAASKTFALINATGQVGKLSVGDILLRKAADSAATAAVTLLSPLTGATGGYSWTFPLGPVASGFGGTESRILMMGPTGSVGYGPAAPAVTIKGLRIAATTGNVTADLDVDASTIAWPGGVLTVPTGGIGTTQLAAGSVTPVKTAAPVFNTSASSGSFTTASGAYVATTSAFSVTLIGGKPVQIQLVGVTGAEASIACGGADAKFRILMDAVTDLGTFGMLDGTQVPPGAIAAVATGLSSGAHTFVLQALSVGGAGVTAVTNCKLFVREG